MKELSIEQKAKAYDEAIEKAKIWQEHLYDVNDKDYADELNYIFPELKESDDEKIRKALIRFHKSTIDIDGIKGDDIVAWLEKRGEQKSIDDLTQQEAMDIAVAKCFEQGEQKPTEEYNITGINSKKAQGKLGEMIKKLKPINDVLEQKPAWSEEDEIWIDRACMLLDELNHLSTLTLAKIPSNVNDIISHLKSLRPQNRWKPSDEQMDVLLSEVTAWTKGCPKQIVLESLYNDLKKLK